MSTEFPGPPALRMRRYRKRLKSGVKYVRVGPTVSEIEEFVRLGLIPKEQKDDLGSIQTAVMTVLYRILEGRDAVTGKWNQVGPIRLA